MNRFFKIAPYLFALSLLIFLVLSLITIMKSPFFLIEDRSSGPARKYHYAFFLPSTDSTFFQELKAGALNASETMDCAISFHELDSDPLSFDFVPYAGYDGIGIYPYAKDERTLTLLNTISEAGIPVVQIENEILRDETTFFIGSNNFETGKAVGRLALKSPGEKISVALVYSEKNPGLMSEGNLIELGLISTIGDRLEEFHREMTSLNPLDAERLTYDLVRLKDSLDIIVLTDPRDTLVAVQAIIDLNLVGMIKVIGFGDDEQIRDYIDKDIVMGTIVRNPFRIGFSAVMALQEISTNGYTSAYVDTGISTVNGGEK